MTPTTLVRTLVSGLAATAAIAACAKKEEAPPAPAPSTPAAVSRVEPAAPALDPAALAAFAPLPAVIESPKNPLTDEKIALGRMLYFEPRLSKNHDLSCNSCHDLARYGVDNEPTSQGHKGQRGSRNSPTVYNAAGHVAQFWDGRAPDVEEQAKGPVLNPVEMAAADEKQIEAVLRSIPGYVEAFRTVWPDDPDPVTYQHMAEAIGAFERKLVTPSRWDRYLAGDRTALAPAEEKGAQVFVASGCTTCHSGAYLGGHMFQKVGLVKPWPDDKDLGRYAVTKQASDRFLFKVPSLRNIEKTGPYFHDGSIPDLATAVRLMGEHQLGRALPDEDVASIVAFLGALTGEVPADYIRAPALPPSGQKTPKPDPS